MRCEHPIEATHRLIAAGKKKIAGEGWATEFLQNREQVKKMNRFDQVKRGKKLLRYQA